MSTPHRVDRVRCEHLQYNTLGMSYAYRLVLTSAQVWPSGLLLAGPRGTVQKLSRLGGLGSWRVPRFRNYAFDMCTRRAWLAEENIDEGGMTTWAGKSKLHPDTSIYTRRTTYNPSTALYAALP